MCGHGPQIGRSYMCVDGYYDNNNVSAVFSFLTQYDRSWQYAGNLEAAILLVLFALSVIGNVYVLKVILAAKQKSKMLMNMFVSNLIFADLMFVITAPFISAVRITSKWVLGQFMCSFVNYWLFVCGSTMIWTMSAISIDRYVNINVGISTEKRLPRRHVVIINAALWLIGILSFIPLALNFKIVNVTANNNSFQVCSLLWTNLEKDSNDQSIIFVSVVAVIDFILPVVIIITNYARIYVKFRQSRRTIENFNTATFSRNNNTGQSKLQRNTAKYRVLKTLVSLVLAFIVMWVPVMIVFSIIEHDIVHKHYRIPSSVLVWTIALCYLNTIVNALMYGMATKQVRDRVDSIREMFTNRPTDRA